MLIESFKKREGCYKPVERRLGSLQTKDDFECYGESYVKCFWSLCDHQKSTEALVAQPTQAVVTQQPRRLTFDRNTRF